MLYLIPPPGTADSAVRPNLRPAWVDHDDGAVEASTATGAEPEMYFFGLIDILTAWCPAKRSEFTLKALMHPTKWRGISCQAPDLYANRFERALRKWFV